MDYSGLIGLGAALQAVPGAFNRAREHDEELAQRAFENQRQQQLLALALSKGELEKQAAQREQQQLEANIGGQQFNQAMGLARSFGGQQLPASAVSGLGNWRDVIAKDVPASAGVKIYTSPDAAPDSLQTVGQQAPGQVEIATPFDSKLAVAQVQAQSRMGHYDDMQALNEKKLALQDAWHQASNDIDRQRIAAQMEALNARLQQTQTLNGTKQTASLQKQFAQDTKEEREVIYNLNKIQQGMKLLADPANSNKTAAQKMIIDGYEKIGNPGAVIRQAGLAQDIGHQGLWDAMQGSFDAWAHGGFKMNDPAMAQFQKVANAVGSKYVGSYKSKRDQFTRLAATNPNINPDLVTGEDLAAGLDVADSANPQTPATAPASTTPKFTIRKVR